MKETLSKLRGKGYLTNIIESSKEKIGRSNSEAFELTDPFVKDILLDTILSLSCS